VAKPNKIATVAQKRRWEALEQFGCIVGYLIPSVRHQCCGALTRHHTHVGGSRPNRSPFRNHDKVIILCHNHHQGKDGIDPPEGMGTLAWEALYGSEDYFLHQSNKLLEVL
jgi:hypothetical protein